MDAVIQTEGLGKRYGDKWALADCSLEVPPGPWRAWSGRTERARPRC